MENKQPLLSVIVPVYNAEKWLKECIDSIVTQSFIDFELILIDDGSNDHSGEICDYYRNIDPRIVVSHIGNSGVSNARNLGIKLSRGKWLTFIDSDDWIASNYFQSFKINDAEYDICYQGVKYVYENGHEETLFSYSDLMVNDAGANAKSIEESHLLFDGCPIAKIFRSSIVREHEIKFNSDISMHEDHIFVFDYLLHSKTISCVAEIGYNYRRGIEGSLSSKVHKPENLFKASDLLIERVRQLYKNGWLSNGIYYDKLLTHYGYSQRLRGILNLYILNYDKHRRSEYLKKEKKCLENMNFYKKHFISSSVFRAVFIDLFCYLPTNIFDSLLWTIFHRGKI